MAAAIDDKQNNGEQDDLSFLRTVSNYVSSEMIESSFNSSC
jgi:hypothetical protein